jgi:hypothetical protein
MTTIKKTFPKWKEERNPYFIHNREGCNTPAKRFKIYEDDKVKVCRVEEPTYFNEFENTIQVQIKKSFILFDMAIGGCISKEDAIHNAKFIVSKLVKY